MAGLIQAYGMGSLPEMADGDLPHRPRGCIAQAASVAEALRAYHQLAGERRRQKRRVTGRTTVAEALARV
jgi:glycogen debranching enzyme